MVAGLNEVGYENWECGKKMGSVGVERWAWV